MKTQEKSIELDNTTKMIAETWAEGIEHDMAMMRISLGSSQSNSDYHREEYRKSIEHARHMLDNLKRTLNL